MHDGFGNRLQQNVTKGSAPTQSLLVSGTTNRITTSGFAYDSNGNMTANPQVPTMIYDPANRLIESSTGSYTSKYSYDHANKRIYKFTGSASTAEFYFYGWNGELMGAYKKTNVTGWGWTSYAWEPKWTNVSFAGRLIQAQSNWVVTDRLGSVRWRSNSQGGSTTFAYYPYGDPASPSSSSQSENRFATYVRDLQTGLDYADQRYHTAAYGRFLTPDPYQASAGPADPGSWNRYAYVENDPVNRNDPSGLDWVFLAYGVPDWAEDMHNPNTLGHSRWFAFQFVWAGPGSALSAPVLPYSAALRMTPSLPGVERFRQMTPTTVAIDVVDFTHPLEHARNLMRGFRKYFYDNWSDPCVQWLNGRGLSRKDFRKAMDRVIDRMRSGHFIEWHVDRPPYGLWTSTLHGWFETYGGNHIMMNRNVESFWYGLSLRSQQTHVLHELGHIFSASGFWQDDGRFRGPGQHPNDRMVVENCGHLLGRWFHGR